MKNILIAEDDPVSMRILAKTMEDMSFNVTQACNGSQAIKALEKSHDFSLLISDMIMPEVDGWKLIEKVRQDNKTKDIPIIIISGVVPIHDIYDVLQAGASRFLPKPVNITMLKDYVNSLVQKE